MTPSLPSPPDVPRVRISVVVPTYRRRHLLVLCLDALLRQDFDPAAYEIVVADDGTSPNTEQVVRRVADGARVAVRYVPVTHAHGPAAARNAGWRTAAGEVIAFTDDDCLPDSGWLRAGAAAFAPGATAAWGRLVMPLPPTPTDYARNAARLERAPFVTANCFVRRDALVVVGGFDERFTVPWREDNDLYFSLLEYGARIVHVPSAVVIHPVRPAPWGVSLRQQRKSLYNALLYKKHPYLYREYVQAAPPWRYYAVVGSILGVASGLATGHLTVALVDAGAWALLTGQFCAQRLRQTSHRPDHVAEMVVTSALIPPLAVFWRLRGALRFRVLFL